MDVSKDQKASSSDRELQGEYGRYRLGEKIGRGGNGRVYAAILIDGGDLLPQGIDFVIKRLKTFSCKEENTKRKQRFKNEVEQVREIQDEINGIIPIYDASSLSEKEQGQEWYLMPKASEYLTDDLSIEERLKDMMNLGHCLSRLHEKGIVHRDIKPQNLLIWKDRLCLSDFGLVSNLQISDDHLTVVQEHLGPWAIRPPEMRSVEDIRSVDYTKSDVYLFAKTVWITLMDKPDGFEGEYSRALVDIYMNRDLLGVETAEPLHEMMEGATMHYWWDRITIDECVRLIEEQLAILSHKPTMRGIDEWKYLEVMNEIYKVMPEDSKKYQSEQTILAILQKLNGIGALVFEETGQEYEPLDIKGIRLMPGNLFELEVRQRGYKRLLRVFVRDITMVGYNLCEMHIIDLPDDLPIAVFDPDKDVVYTRLMEAFQSKAPCIYVSGHYMARILPLGAI